MSLDMIVLTTPDSTGGAGASVGLKDSPLLRGEIVAIYLSHTVAAAAPTVTVKGVSVPITYLNRVGSKADGLYPVRITAVDNTGANLTYDGTRKVVVPYPLADQLELKLTNANDGDTVTAFIWYTTRASWG